MTLNSFSFIEMPLASCKMKVAKIWPRWKSVLVLSDFLFDKLESDLAILCIPHLKYRPCVITSAPV